MLAEGGSRLEKGSLDLEERAMHGQSTRSLLLTNDDGIDAPGFQALLGAVDGLGELSVVAPFGPYSGCGHIVTTHAPITIAERGERRYAVEGSPADCVRLGLVHLAPQFDWVISGINAGGNLGTDIYHSGTVAAVREAVIQGRPGIAVSHYIARGRPIDWTWAAARARRVIDGLLERPWESGTFWNVNLPHPPPGAPEPKVVFCPLDPSPLPVAYRLESGGGVAHYSGDYQTRARIRGADVEVCFGGDIAVTLIRLAG
jgi:5'-nucleotidase